jgi:hypothetical protein
MDQLPRSEKPQPCAAAHVAALPEGDLPRAFVQVLPPGHSIAPVSPGLVFAQGDADARKGLGSLKSMVEARRVAAVKVLSLFAGSEVGCAGSPDAKGAPPKS